jgi:hypothetical protein
MSVLSRLLALLALVALGCGDDASKSTTLSPGDVTNLPPGNAVGASFSGNYVIQTSMIVACECRVGSCSQNVHASTGALLALSHRDGALRIDERRDGKTTALHNGGIDREGKFRAGFTGTIEAFTWTALMEGTVTPGVSIEARTRFTAVGETGGDNIDCDAENEYHAQYTGPLSPPVD